MRRFIVPSRTTSNVHTYIYHLKTSLETIAAYTYRSVHFRWQRNYSAPTGKTCYTSHFFYDRQ